MNISSKKHSGILNKIKEDNMRFQRNKLYTISQVAKALGIHVRTVHHHVSKMKLGQRVGMQILLTADDVKALRSRRTKVGRPPKESVA